MSKPKSLGIRDVFYNLKTSLIGTKTDDIDKQIDSALGNIRTYGVNTGRNQYIETMKNLVGSIGNPTNDDFMKDINQIGGIDAFQQGDRVSRYKEYDAIVTNIAYYQRALKVLTDNILAPDDISKRSIRIISEEDEKLSHHDLESDVIARLKNINFEMGIEKYMDKLVSTTLKKGDYFIELIHSPKGEHALTILQESNTLNEADQSKTVSHEHTIMNETITGSKVDRNNDKKTQEFSTKVIVTEYNPSFGGTLSQRGPEVASGNWTKTHSNYNYSGKSKSPDYKNERPDSVGDGWEDNIKNKAKKKEKEKFDNSPEEVELRDLFLTLHDPQYVIRLETERFRTCLGYLVFPKVDAGQQFTSMWTTTTNTVDSICLKIIDNLEKRLSTGQDNLPKTGDLKDAIMHHLQYIKDQEDLKIRYVQPEMMSHWKINSGGLFDPYGESIFESVKFDSKLYMALKTAMTIKRLTSATDKRVIKIETGLPRNAKNLIEMMKESLRKRKISIDKFGSVDSIPSHITTFEDIYIPMRDGKNFVDVEAMQFGPDPQQDTEPLKFIRDNIVANLNVPPAFVGLEENTCFSFSTKIPLLNGQTVTMKDLVDAYENDPESFDVWVYSIDPETHRVVPGKVTKAMKTRKNAQMVRVYLDNGEYEECTPDHRWMLRDGSYKEAKDLVEGDSLMPLYRKESSHKTKNNCTYTQVMHPSTQRYQLCHRMVSEGLNKAKKNDGMNVHHIDRNPKNNHPDNLLVCSAGKHLSLHSDARYRSGHESTYSIKETRNCCICDTEFECRLQSNQSTCLSSECITERKRLDGHKSWQKRKDDAGDLYDMVEVECAGCGKKFFTYKKYEMESKYDMISCGDYECGRIVTGKKVTLTKVGEPIDTNCVICDKPITIKNPKKNLTNTCSEVCRNTVLARRRFKGNVQTVECSFCGSDVQATKYKREHNRFLCCDEPECKSAKQGVELYLRNNPDETIETYRDKFNNKELPFQIKNDRMNKEVVINHKVVKVEFLEERQDCCDIEVDKYHNFALDSGVFVHNSNRALLTVENILFARTIVSYQSEFSFLLKDLFEKIYALIYPTKQHDLDHISITFPPPKASSFEHEMEYLEQLTRIIETLKTLGIPAEYAKKKYLPDYDWEAIDKFNAEEKAKNALGDNPTNEEGMSGGGYGGF